MVMAYKRAQSQLQTIRSLSVILRVVTVAHEPVPALSPML
jgi:hypothetical protein